MRDRVLRLMIDDGMTLDTALDSLTALKLTAIGLVLAQRTLNGPKGTEMARRFDKNRADIGRGTGELAPRLAITKVGRFDFDTQYEVTIEALVSGLGRTAD